jgi:hypothetical protein
MKVLLVCKGEYRYFFPAIARALQERYDAAACAITFSSAATRMLQKTGTFCDLFNLAAHLKSHVRQINPETSRSILQKLEALAGGIKINTMIHADRIVSRYSHEQILSTLAGASEFWDGVLNQAQPDVIIGEVACATEWIGWLKAHHSRIPYLIPSATPVAKRFYFLNAPDGAWKAMDAAFAELQKRELTFGEIMMAEQFVRSFRDQKTKPPFLSWAQRSPLTPEFSRLARRTKRISFRVRSYIEDGKYEVGSHHGTPPWRPLWEDATRIMRHATAEAALLAHRVDEQWPYVYFPLHVQPEFTTDVRAPFFTNQVALIENISKSLPPGYEIMVKEHPGMKGERALGEYRALKKLHNVQLLSPSIDSHRLIQGAAAVLTITGSSAWEAMLYEKPVIAFGPLYYGFSRLSYQCEKFKDLPGIISEALGRFVSDHRELLKLVVAFLQTAYELEWGDPIRQPHIVEMHNAEKVADAIATEIASSVAHERPETMLA